MTQSDVTRQLKDLGYECRSDQGATYKRWTCELDIFTVTEMYGNGDASIVFINSTAPRASAASILGYLATVKYTNNDPQAARAWVQGTIQSVSEGNPKETTFGGVKYELLGNANLVWLQIGQLSP